MELPIHWVKALGAIALAEVVGWSLTSILDLRRRFSPSQRAALGYLFGIAFLAGGMYVESHLFAVPLRRGPILLTACVPVIAALLVRPLRKTKMLRLRAATNPSRSRGFTVAVTCLAASVFAGLLADALTNAVTDWDGVMTWCAQARFVRSEQTVDASVLRDSASFVTNRGYPLLLPVAQVVAQEVFDTTDDRVIRPLYAAFFPCFLVLVYGMCRRYGRLSAAISVAVACLMPYLSFVKDGGPAGTYSDFPLACFLTAAIFLLFQGGRGVGVGFASGLTLGAAVLTKNEGLPLAALIPLSYASFILHARLCRRKKQGLRGRIRIGAPVVAFVFVAGTALFLESWRAPIGVSAYSGYFTFLHDHGTRAVFLRNLWLALIEVTGSFFGDRWSWFWVPWGVILLTTERSFSRWPAPILGAVLGAIAVGAATAYGGASEPAALARTTWDRFLVQGSGAWLALFGIALGRSLTRSRSRARAAVVGLMLATTAAASISRTGKGVAEGLSDLVRYSSESVDDMFARVRGPDYAASIVAARREVPERGGYLLLKGTPGAALQNLVRYDLAPRRPWFLGAVAGTRKVLVASWRPGAPTRVVITRGPGEAVALKPKEDVARDWPEFFLGVEDQQMPLGFDSPSEGETVGDRLVLRGWCQDGPTDVCVPRYLWSDGEPRVMVRLERFARPDVATLLPRLGPCRSAGFEAEFKLEEGDRGPRTLTLFVDGVGGRFRRLDRRIVFAR